MDDDMTRLYRHSGHLYREALPYRTQPAVPARQRQQFERDIQVLHDLEFPKLQRLCVKLKGEDQRELDWLCEAVEQLVAFPNREGTGSFDQALHLYKIMQDADYDKLKWLRYYTENLLRAVEEADDVEQRIIPQIVEGIQYLMQGYFYAEDWDIQNPSVIPRSEDQRDFDEFFGETGWNPAAVLAELDQFADATNRVRKGVEYEKAWYDYIVKKSSEQYSTKPDKIFPPGVEDLEVMWHVTTAYSAILDHGFKTKRQLRDEGTQPGGVGGGRDDLISFTASFEHAQGIQDGILDLVEMAHNPPTAQQIIDRFQEMGLSVEGLREGIKYYESSWGGPIKDLGAPMPFDQATSLYRPLLMRAQGEGLAYDPFFSGPDEKVFQAIDPDDVQIIEAVVNTTAEETTYHWAEEEWRIPVQNIVSFGPVGSQKIPQQRAAAYRRAPISLKMITHKANEAQRFLVDLSQELQTETADRLQDCCLWELQSLRMQLSYLVKAWNDQLLDPDQATRWSDLINIYSLYGQFEEYRDRVDRAWRKLEESAQETRDTDLQYGRWGELPEIYDYEYGEGSFEAEAVSLLEDLPRIPAALQAYAKLIDALEATLAWNQHKSQQYQRGTEPEGIHPPGVEDTEVVWHATTAYRDIMRDGFKLRSQMESSGGLGGSQSLADWQQEGISFTGNQEIAQGIMEAYWDLAEILQGPRDRESLMRFADRLQVPEATIRQHIPYLWNMSDDSQLEPYAAFSVYRNIIGQASVLGHYYDPVFIAEKGMVETFLNLDLNDVGVIEATINTTDPATRYYRSMDEWRVPLDAIVSFGAVGSQQHSRTAAVAVTAALTHRRQQDRLNPQHVMMFAEDQEYGYEPNEHYGPHVWTLVTELPPVPECVAQHAADYFGVSLEDARELVDPPNIVSDAGAWDSPEFCYEVWEQFEEPGYRTQDGAVVLDRYAVELQYHHEDSPEQISRVELDWERPDYERHAAVVKTAAKIVMYHGTATGQNDQLLKRVLKEGLIPDPQDRVWGERLRRDPDDYSYWQNREKESLGGVYFTTKPRTTNTYMNEAQRALGGDGMVIIAQIETRTPTVTLDEETLFGYHQLAVGHYIAHRSQGKLIPADGGSLPMYLLRGNIDWRDVARWFIETELANGVLREWEIPEQRVKAILPLMAAALRWQAEFAMAEYHQGKTGWSYRDYDEYGRKSPEDALRNYRAYTEAVLQKFRELADVPARNESFSGHNIRVLEPVTYRGANRILAVLRVQDVKRNHDWETKTVDAPYHDIGTVVYSSAGAEDAVAQYIESWREAQGQYMLWTDKSGTVLYDEPDPRYAAPQQEKAAAVNTNTKEVPRDRRTTARSSADRDTGISRSPGGRADAQQPQDPGDTTAARPAGRRRREPVGTDTAAAPRIAGDQVMQHPKPNVEIDGTDVTAHLRGTVRVAQDPPDDAPSEFEMTEEQEQKPGANWRDLYLQPVIRAIRNRFDLPKGSVTLVGPKKKTPFGDDSLGFELTGHVRFEDFKPPTKQYGRAPYRFTCSVSPEGELLLPVELQGSPVE